MPTQRSRTLSEHLSDWTDTSSDDGAFLPPKFITPLEAVTAQEGTKAKFTCKLQTAPGTLIVWRKDGAVMENGEDFMQEYDEKTGICQMIIDDAFAEDQGVISCDAVNIHGQDSTACQFTVLDSTEGNMKEFTEEHFTSELETLSFGKPPKIVQDIKAYRVPPHVKLALNIEVISDPVATFVWSVNDQPVTGNPKIRVSSKGNQSSLTIHGPVEGTYKVQAKNPVGAATSYGYVALLKPLPSPREAKPPPVPTSQADTAPRFLHEVPHVTVAEGEEVAIDVEVAAWPSAKFIWFINDSEVAATSGIVEFQQPKPNHCRALFLKPQKGEYKVIATNRAGTAESVGSVNVESTKPPDVAEFSEEHCVDELELTFDKPPRIINGFKAYRIPPNSKLTLEVEVESDPTAQFQWFANDQPVVTSGKYFIKAVGNKSALTIAGAEEGTYKVAAKNTAGAATNYGYVAILTPLPPKPAKPLPPRKEAKQEPPQFIHDVPVLTVEEHKPVTIDVEVTASPPATFTWLINGREVPGADLQLSFPQPNRCQATFPRPKEGEYTAVATNPAGEARSVGRIHVEKPPPPPEPKLAEFTEEHAVDEVELDFGKPPKFIEGIKACRVPPNSKITIEVEVKSDPEASFSWFANDAPVVTSGVYEVKSRGNKSSLTVDCPAEGIYKVRATNPAGVATSYGYVAIIELVLPPAMLEVSERVEGTIVEKRETGPPPEPPRFIHDVPVLTIRKGDPIMFDVEVTARPPAEFTWYVNGDEMVPKPGEVDIRCPQPNRCVVRIRHPSRGEYKVIARNVAGHAVSIGRVNIEAQRPPPPKMLSDIIAVSEERVMNFKMERFEVPIPIPPRFIHEVPRLTIDHDEDLVITVDVEAAPPAQFTWFFDGNQLMPHRDMIMKTLRPNICEILLKNPKPGQYKAIAKNDHGVATSIGKISIREKPVIEPDVGKDAFVTEETTISSVVERVETGPPPKPPRIMRGVPDITVRKDEPINITIVVDSTPPCQFEWYHDDRTFKPGPNEAIINYPRPNECNLKMPKAIPGKFRVVAINPHGKDESWGTVRILPPPPKPPRRTDLAKTVVTEERVVGKATERVQTGPPPLPPRFIREVPVLTVKEGQNISIEVLVEAQPAAQFSWFINGVEVPPQRLKMQQPKPNMCRIAVANPQPGHYKAIARNQHGTATSVGRVNILVPERPPTPKQDVSTTVTWQERVTEGQSEKVPSPPPQIPPRFIRGVPTITTREKPPLKITIEVEAVPAAQFRLFVNNKNAEPSEIKFPRPNVCEVTFLEPITGLYKAVATNPCGSAFSVGKITVQPLPKQRAKTALTTLVTEEWVIAQAKEVVTSSPKPYAPAVAQVSIMTKHKSGHLVANPSTIRRVPRTNDQLPSKPYSPIHQIPQSFFTSDRLPNSPVAQVTNREFIRLTSPQPYSPSPRPFSPIPLVPQKSDVSRRQQVVSPTPYSPIPPVPQAQASRQELVASPQPYSPIPPVPQKSRHQQVVSPIPYSPIPPVPQAQASRHELVASPKPYSPPSQQGSEDLSNARIDITTPVKFVKGAEQARQLIQRFVTSIPMHGIK